MTGVFDRELSSDRRYVALKTAVFTNDYIKHLPLDSVLRVSVYATRLRISDAYVWNIILAQLTRIRRIGGVLDNESISKRDGYMIITLVSQSCTKLSPQFISAAASAFLRDICHWNEKDMRCILVFLRRTYYSNNDSPDVNPRDTLIRNVLQSFESRLEEFGADAMAVILYDFAKLNVIPHRAIHRASNRINSRLHELSPRSGAMFCIALAHFRFRKTAILRRIASRISAEGLVQDICMALYATARLRLRLNGLILRVCSLLTDSQIVLSPLCLSRITSHFGVLGVAQANDVVSSRIYGYRDVLSPAEMVTFLVYSAKISSFPADSVQSVVQILKKRISGLSTRQIIDALWAFARLGLTDKFFIEKSVSCLAKIDHVYSRSDHAKMSFFAFAFALESPKVELAPSSKALLSRFRHGFGSNNNRTYIDHLVPSLNNVKDVQVQHVPGQLGPYQTDAIVLKEGRSLAIEILSESAYCPISGSLLSWYNCKKRHLHLIGLEEVISMRKRDMPHTVDGLSDYFRSCLLRHS